MYSLENLETEVTQTQKVLYQVPQLEEEDTWFIRYVIRYKDHPYVNLRVLKINQGNGF